MPIQKRVFALFGALSAVSVLSLAGCDNARQPDELARAVAVGERPVAMTGSAVFFGGKIGATVTISRGIGSGTGERGKGGDNAKVLETFGMDKDYARAYINAKNNVGSPLPPVTMHLRISSMEKTTAVVEITDFESDLGNFAVYPAVLALAPAQTAEPEPMISQLGVTSDEIPVKVGIRWNKTTESRTIMVRSVMVKDPAAQ